MPSLSIPIFSRFSLTLRVAFSTPLCQRCLGSMIFAKEWLDRDCYMTTVCGPLWKYWSILYFQIWKTFTSIFLCALSPSSSRIAWLIHYIITGNPLHSDSNKWTALCRWRKAVSQGTMGNDYSRNKANTFTRVWTLQTIKGESQLNLQQKKIFFFRLILSLWRLDVTISFYSTCQCPLSYFLINEIQFFQLHALNPSYFFLSSQCGTNLLMLMTCQLCRWDNRW